MRYRRTAICLVAGLGIQVLAALLLLVSSGSAQTLPTRIFFQIVTGPTGGTYFPIGQLIAGLVIRQASIVAKAAMFAVRPD